MARSRSRSRRRAATPEHVFHGIRFATHPDVYDPSDDTYLLIDAVQTLPPGRFLEVGTGAGLVALAAARNGHDVVATDVSSTALRLARENARRNGLRVALVRADLLAGLRSDRFDTVVFNPPYLPTRPEERVPGALNRAFDGGADGRAVLERFLQQLAGTPRVLVVTSSLQGPRELELLFGRLGHAWEVLAERAFAQERLRVVALRRAPSKA